MILERETNIYNPNAIATAFRTQDTRLTIEQGKINAIISETELIELLNGGITMYSAMNNIDSRVDGTVQEISRLDTRIDAESGEIVEVNSKLATYKNTLDEHSATLSQTQGDISNLQTSYSSLAQTVGGFTQTVAKSYIRKAEAESTNLLYFPYYSKSATGDGITWTVNDDCSITINGTATREARFWITFNGSASSVPADARFLTPGKYTFYYTIYDKDIPANTIYAYFALSSYDGQWTKTKSFYNRDTSGVSTYIRGEQIEVPKSVVPSHVYVSNIYIRIPTGKTINNVTLYPQLAYGDFSDSDFPKWESPIMSSATIAQMSSIKQTADQIELQVQGVQGNVDSGEYLKTRINLDTSGVKIDAKHFNVDADSIRLRATKLSWSSTYSSMTENGTLTAQNANITGTIKNGTTFNSIYQNGKIEFYRNTTNHGYIDGVIYDKSVGRYGVSIMGYGGVTIHGPVFGLGNWYSKSSTATREYKEGKTGYLHYMNNFKAKGSGYTWDNCSVYFYKGILNSDPV